MQIIVETNLSIVNNNSANFDYNSKELQCCEPETNFHRQESECMKLFPILSKQDPHILFVNHLYC